VPARFDAVSDLTLCTSVANEDGVKVATIEHLMAALAGCGVDNVVVELDGPEVPAMDGSAAPFVFLIECADIVEQAASRRYIEVLRPIEVRDGERSARLEPAAGFSVSFEIDFPNAVVGEQSCHVQLYNGTFKSELCRARTFGFVSEFEKLQALGLARGGSLENAIVVSGDRVLNEEGLRYDNEFVRHKALDSIGDLYLAGAPILGHFHGTRSGHALNNRLLQSLFADADAWRMSNEPAAWAEHRAVANA
jgi:UDP-3-O-[3-hydroxymyristoyl] N-acetylglucosamine deacetylase